MITSPCKMITSTSTSQLSLCQDIYNTKRDSVLKSILYVGGAACPNAAMNHDYTLWCDAQFAYSITISQQRRLLTLQYSMHRVNFVQDATSRLSGKICGKQNAYFMSQPNFSSLLVPTSYVLSIVRIQHEDLKRLHRCCTKIVHVWWGRTLWKALLRDNVVPRGFGNPACM